MLPFFLALGATAAASSFPPLPAPPLGYSTWQWFPGTHWGQGQGQYNAVDEATCRAQADAMVEKGLVAAGYTVFIVDEPCFAGRDASGALLPNTTTWPNGFAPFGRYLAERGMQLGIYTDAGKYTCQGCPASAGHEAQDMETFMSWGATYVKVDRCFGVDDDQMREDLPETFAKYRAAAEKSSRRVQISAILAATDNCWEWCEGVCDHCRTTEDIRNSLGAMEGHVDAQESIPYIADFAKPGYFNDLDMMIVGNMSQNFYSGPSALTPDETKSHIALWAVLKSPMLLSCDVRSLSPETVGLLTNPRMLAIFNDALAQQARRLATAAGSPTPTSLTFDSCPPAGQPPLARQQWSVEGQMIVSKASGRAVTLSDCGTSNSRLVLCGSDPENERPGPSCSNTSCPEAKHFNSSGLTAAAAPLLNAYSQQCMEGMLGPGRSSVVTSACSPENVKQLWSLHSDGTLRASNTRNAQCLTAELGAPTADGTVDVFAGALADGGAAVVFFNRGAAESNASLPLSALGKLPGWKAGGEVRATEVWTGAAHSTVAAGGELQSGAVPAQGVAFLRLGKVNQEQ